MRGDGTSTGRAIAGVVAFLLATTPAMAAATPGGDVAPGVSSADERVVDPTFEDTTSTVVKGFSKRITVDTGGADTVVVRFGADDDPLQAYLLLHDEDGDGTASFVFNTREDDPNVWFSAVGDDSVESTFVTAPSKSELPASTAYTVTLGRLTSTGSERADVDGDGSEERYDPEAVASVIVVEFAPNVETTEGVSVDGSTVRLKPDARITWNTQVPDGSELTVRVRRSTRPHPFVEPVEVTVSDGEFGAEFDVLGDLPREAVVEGGVSGTLSIRRAGRTLAEYDLRVVLERPSVDVSVEPSTPSTGETVTLDAAGSSDPDGEIASYGWDLDGDGTTDATGETVAHRFEEPGGHPVRVRVTDADDVTATATVTVPVNAPPVPNVGVDPEAPAPDETVAFDATASTDPDGEIASYGWDLNGDGTVEKNGATTEWTFRSAGVHGVTLTVADRNGSRVDTRILVPVSERGPIDRRVLEAPPEEMASTTLSATNRLDERLDVRVTVEPPAPVAVGGGRFENTGPNRWEATMTVPPGETKRTTIELGADEFGNHTVEAVVTYSAGNASATVRDRIALDVRSPSPEPTPTAGDGADTTDPESGDGEASPPGDGSQDDGGSGGAGLSVLVLLGLLVAGAGGAFVLRSAGQESTPEDGRSDGAEATSGAEDSGTPSGTDGSGPGSAGGGRPGDGDGDGHGHGDDDGDGDGGSHGDGDRDAPGGSGGPPSSIPTVEAATIDYEEIERGERIGAGGNADVYEATAPGVGRIALKQPRFEGTVHAEAVERFSEEAETWSKLDDGDHVVGVVDWGTDPLPWLALEYMDGGDLREYAGELGVERAVWTAIGIAKGVRHAHRHGVVHLDLKPGNVLLRESEGWPVPKVGDWGLAKLLLEHSESVEGLSPSYAAPEQFDPEEFGDPDERTDVYGLGAVLYELFTGRPPFEGKPTTVMRAVMDDQPTPPSEVDEDLPPELDDVLLKALAKRKDDRYEDVVLLRNDLQEVYESP